MKNNNKIKTNEQGFIIFSKILYRFYKQELLMCKKGLLYNEKKYKKKVNA